MTHYKPAKGITQEEIDAFRAECREEGKGIDPLNCEVLRLHVHVLDPYGVYDLPPEAQCIGADLVRAQSTGRRLGVGTRHPKRHHRGGAGARIAVSRLKTTRAVLSESAARLRVSKEGNRANVP